MKKHSFFGGTNDINLVSKANFCPKMAINEVSGWAVFYLRLGRKDVLGKRVSINLAFNKLVQYNYNLGKGDSTTKEVAAT